MKRYRVYADTSVFGGCFDEEFSEQSNAFFAEIKAGRLSLVISPIVLAELDRAPKKVQEVLASLPPESVELIDFSSDVSELRNAYIKAEIITPESAADAEHIAYASVADVDFAVSWNFKHIVNYRKISGYQAVNLLNGYRQINIYCPSEVVNNET